MAFDDEHCPCGGKKRRETMLCAECVAHVKDTLEWRVFTRDPVGMAYVAQRNAAIRLLKMARERKVSVRRRENGPAAVPDKTAP